MFMVYGKKINIMFMVYGKKINIMFMVYVYLQNTVNKNVYGLW